MSEYITIKEAVSLTGKSDKTIRRNIINVQDSLNKGRQIKIVSKQGSKYYILKSYITGIYRIEKTLKMSSRVTNRNSVKTNKKDKYLSKYIDRIEKENEDLKGVRDTLLETTKELTRQNDQSQRLIAQLQQTNTTPAIGSKKQKQTVKENDSYWWLIISLLVIVILSIFV